MTITHMRTPKQDGFWMPGEFERHSGCWMLWPERSDVWRLGAKPAQKAFAAVAEAIAGSGELVTVGVSRSQFENARSRLASHIRVIEVSYDDAWARDNGPTFVRNGAGEVRGVDWTFNAWGGLIRGAYFPWDKDNELAEKILEIERVDRYRSPLICEGGALLSDGRGTLIVTEPTIIGPGRNSHLDRSEADRMLMDYLGVEKVIWLPEGAIGDETGGHIDVICSFSAPGRLLISWPIDEQSPGARVASANLEILEAAYDASGAKFQLVKVPEPPPHVVSAEEVSSLDMRSATIPRRAGELVSRTHLNFYIANDRVIVPIYDAPTDDAAVAAIADAFPDRPVEPIMSREIMLGGGSIHCITQQVPLSLTQPWLGR